MKRELDVEIIKEIQSRLDRGDNLWSILDRYELTMDEKIEILRVFDDQRWD